MILIRTVALLSFVVFSAGCAGLSSVAPGEVCTAARFAVVDDFAGARRGRCRAVDEDRVVLKIRREDRQVVNRSPWFSFRIEPDAPGRAEVVLDYGRWMHRYRPKTSRDGVTWELLPEERVTLTRNGRRATLALDMDGEALWVSAQELITPTVYDAWNERIAGTTDTELSLLGQSLEGRPIAMLSSSGDRDEVVMLIGRQHPPEISGAFAFFAFTSTVLGDSPLAREFRERFAVIAVPLLNPDGVTRGHFRHNVGETDLNRDWGVFSQPETRLVGNLLDELDREGRKLAHFVDFHSTKRNLFYTFPDDATDPPRFFTDWFERARPRLAGVDYPFENDPSLGDNMTVAKAYINQRYGIPAVTYEVGDETDRDAARRAAVVFAEEFMRLALER